MLIFKTSIPEELSTYLRLYEYEQQAHKIALERICNSPHCKQEPDEWRDKKYNEHWNGLRESVYAKNAAFDEITMKNIPEAYRGINYRLEVSFSRNEVYVYDDSIPA